MPRSQPGRVTTDDLGDGHVQHHHLELRSCEQPQRLARELVRAALDARATTSEMDDAEVVASKLVTNALKHTSEGPVRMDVDVYEDTAVLWVHDHDSSADAVKVPASPPDEDQLEGGRGLFLVDALVERWFVWPVGQGKAVVAVMPLGRGRRPRTP